MFLEFARLSARPGLGHGPHRDSTEESCRASGIETSPERSIEKKRNAQDPRDAETETQAASPAVVGGILMAEPGDELEDCEQACGESGCQMNKKAHAVPFESWVRVPITLAGAEGVSAGTAEAVGYVEIR